MLRPRSLEELRADRRVHEQDELKIVWIETGPKPRKSDVMELATWRFYADCANTELRAVRWLGRSWRGGRAPRPNTARARHGPRAEGAVRDGHSRSVMMSSRDREASAGSAASASSDKTATTS